MIRKSIRAVLHVLRLTAGWLVYAITGRTPAFSHQSMIWLFCTTGGRSNDLQSRMIGLLKRPARLANGTGLLGDMNDDRQRSRVLTQLRERGYYVFDRCLDEATCDRLVNYALTHPSLTRRGDDPKADAPRKVVYTRGAPQSIRYDFDPEDLLRVSDVQKVLADLSVAALAQAYLGARPVVDVLTMWWHTDFSHEPDAEAGQFFHFDMDRPKWLKLFVYLTDVTPQSGPHAFVAGSHRTGGIPRSLLRKGYARLTDEDVAGTYAAADILELTAPRGSIIAEDTRGLHKGKHVQHGDRLVLQFQYSNSLFGAQYRKHSLGADLSPELRASLERHSWLYAAYQ